MCTCGCVIYDWNSKNPPLFFCFSLCKLVNEDFTGTWIGTFVPGIMSNINVFGQRTNCKEIRGCLIRMGEVSGEECKQTENIEPMATNMKYKIAWLE